MAYKQGILGQLDATAATEVSLYTVPASKFCTARVIVCNRSASGVTFRVRIRINAAGDSDSQFLTYDKAVAANDAGSTLPFALNAGDVVRVEGSSSSMSFSLSGIEEDQP